MFVFFNTIYATNEYMINTSDKHLNSAIQHELGHKHYFPFMFIMFILLVLTISITFLLIPISIFILLPFSYLMFCYLCRIGEYMADVYALEKTSMEGMIELLIDEGKRLDTPLSNWFYLLRFHPNSEKRIKRLKGKSIPPISD